MDFLRKILLHVSAICCFACIITAILDWYNPYMAFFEHIVPLRIMLYVSVILLALLRKRERPGMLRDRQNECLNFCIDLYYNRNVM